MSSPCDIIARCAADPTFLEEQLVAPSVASGIDFRRVRTFTGLITKVQNNQLWEAIPATLRLMTRCEVALDVFAGYRGEHLRVRSQGPLARTKAFMKYLDRWLSATSPRVPFGLVECFTHERILWGLRRTGHRDANAHQGQLHARVLKQAVPKPALAMKLAAYSANPIRIVETALRLEVPTPPAVPEVHDLLYTNHGGQVRVLAIDPLTASILSLANGENSVETICARLRDDLGISLAMAQALPAFQCLAEQGLLVFEDEQ